MLTLRNFHLCERAHTHISCCVVVLLPFVVMYFYSVLRAALNLMGSEGLSTMVSVCVCVCVLVVDHAPHPPLPPSSSSLEEDCVGLLMAAATDATSSALIGRMDACADARFSILPADVL